MQKNGAAVANILDQFKELSDEDEQEIFKEIQPKILPIFSGSSVINHGVSIQINGNTEDIGKALDKIPPEALGELLKSIGTYPIKHPI